MVRGQPRALARGHGGAGGLYVELSLDGVFVAAGLHRPSSDQLERFRAAIDDERRAERFEEAVASSYRREPRARGAGLKRAPRGYAPDHPRTTSTPRGSCSHGSSAWRRCTVSSRSRSRSMRGWSGA